MTTHPVLARGSGYGILGTGIHLPERVVASAELAAELDIDPGWIEERTGVEERRIAAPEDTAASMAAAAVEEALGHTAQTDDPDMLIVATSTPDRLIPAPAYDVHGLAGLGHMPTLSIDGGCAGIAQAMLTALGYHRAGMADTAVVVGVHRSELLFVADNRKIAPLFGDGAGAFVLGPVPEGYGILSAQMLTDSTHREALRTPDLLDPNPGPRLEMNGPGLKEIFAAQLPVMVDECLAEAGLGRDDVDRVLVHQANIRMVEAFADLLELDRDRVPVSGDRVGNTASASLPISLAMSDDERPLERGDIVVMVTAGAGVNAVVMVQRWYR